MSRYRADRITDPLQDKFSLDDIAWVAPWMADEIRDLGAGKVRRAALDRGIGPELGAADADLGIDYRTGSAAAPG